MSFKEWWEMVADAVSVVGADIVKNWPAFLLIFILYTLLVVFIVKLIYKVKDENLKVRSETIKAQEKEYRKVMKENVKLKKQVSSPQYQAYLASRNLYDENLKESDTLFKKK